MDKDLKSPQSSFPSPKKYSMNKFLHTASDILVSICIPTYDDVASFRRALNSVLCQTHKNIQIIISDDSSNSDIAEYLETIDDTRIVYSKNMPPLGAPANWNYALEMANGDIINLLHHDDFYTSDATLITVVNQFLLKGVEVVVSGRMQYDEDNAVRSVVDSDDYVASFCRHFPNPNFFINKIGSPSILFIVNCLKEVKYDINLSYHVDLEYFYRLFSLSKSTYYVSEPLVSITNGSCNQWSKTCGVDYASRIKELHYCAQAHDFSDKDRFQLSRQLIKEFCFSNPLKITLQQIKRLFLKYPKQFLLQSAIEPWYICRIIFSQTAYIVGNIFRSIAYNIWFFAPPINRRAFCNTRASVVVRTTGRRIKELERALLSITRNNWPDIEIVVVYQGTDEYALEDIRSICNTLHTRCVIVTNLTNEDARAANINIGIKASSGRYLFFLDDDDEFDDCHISTLISTSTSNRSAWSYTGSRVIQNGNIQKLFANDKFSLPKIWRENYIPIHAFMVDMAYTPNHVVRTDERLHWAEDYRMILSLSLFAKPSYTGMVTCTYNLHSFKENTNFTLFTSAQSISKKQLVSVVESDKIIHAYKKASMWRYFLKSLINLLDPLATQERLASASSNALKAIRRFVRV